VPAKLPSCRWGTFQGGSGKPTLQCATTQRTGDAFRRQTGGSSWGLRTLQSYRAMEGSQVESKTSRAYEEFDVSKITTPLSGSYKAVHPAIARVRPCKTSARTAKSPVRKAPVGQAKTARGGLKLSKSTDARELSGGSARWPRPACCSPPLPRGLPCFAAWVCLAAWRAPIDPKPVATAALTRQSRATHAAKGIHLRGNAELARQSASTHAARQGTRAAAVRKGGARCWWLAAAKAPLAFVPRRLAHPPRMPRPRWWRCHPARCRASPP
jgi:hypothetical protein